MKLYNKQTIKYHSPPWLKLHFYNTKKTIMKQLLLSFTALLFCTISFAQLEKNTWLVGGSGSFYSYNEDYNSVNTSFTAKYTNIDFAASVGYFFIDKLSAGLRPSFSSFKGESSGGGSTNSYKLSVGPFARYYFLKQDKQFNILTDLSYQIGFLQQLGALKEKGKYNTLSVMAGTEVFLNSSIGLEILLGYKNQITSIDNSVNSFSSNKTGLQVSIGIQLHLQKE